VKDEDARLGMTLSGHITNANYSMKKGIFLLFINGQIYLLFVLLHLFLLLFYSIMLIYVS